MEVLLDFIKILLPAGLVLYAMYLVVQSFLTKEFEKRLLEVRLRNNDVVLPVRLQAYERCIMLLERMSPHTLLLRLNDPHMNSQQLGQFLVSNIREEFNHNLSQQLYMSDQAWTLIVAAREEIINIINQAQQRTQAESPGIELAKNIFEDLMSRQEDPVAPAIGFLKNEIRTVFG